MVGEWSQPTELFFNEAVTSGEATAGVKVQYRPIVSGEEYQLIGAHVGVKGESTGEGLWAWGEIGFTFPNNQHRCVARGVMVPQGRRVFGGNPEGTFQWKGRFDIPPNADNIYMAHWQPFATSKAFGTIYVRRKTR